LEEGKEVRSRKSESSFGGWARGNDEKLFADK